MKKGVNKLIAALLTLGIICTGIDAVPYASAAEKPKFEMNKNVTVTEGKSKTLKITASGIKKVVSAKWTSSKKKVVKISKSSGKSALIQGLKPGKVLITVKVKYKITSKSKAKSKKLKCTVTVTGSNNAASASHSPSAAAVTATASPTATAAPSQSPEPAPPTGTPTETPLPTRTPGAQNLLSALGEYVGNVGSCIAYSSWNGATALNDPDIKNYINENLNSLTAENEMKPEAILGNRANTITVEKAKEQGVYIPDNYTESKVPVLNYTNIDTLLKYAADNNVRVRYHGLLWHEQTSNWFFRENYNQSGKYVTPEIMDARIEYYIYNIMDYVYKGKYKDIVYCWDVVNEYHHMTECICRITELKKDKPETVKCFYEVYKDAIFENPDDPAHSPVKTNPEYVKKAFMTAYKVLEKYNLTDKVELVYNDYDTNMEDVRATALGVTSYINSKDDINPEGRKLVTTIGMQCHDKLDPRWTIEGHKATMDAFREAGMNFQVTEMDLNKNDKTDEEQLAYWYDFVRLVLNEVCAGAKVTGFTWWGLTDSASWLGTDGAPLLCGTSIKDKKPAYYKVIEAAYSVPAKPDTP